MNVRLKIALSASSRYLCLVVIYHIASNYTVIFHLRIMKGLRPPELLRLDLNLFLPLPAVRTWLRTRFRSFKSSGTVPEMGNRLFFDLSKAENFEYTVSSEVIVATPGSTYTHRKYGTAGILIGPVGHEG